MTLGDIILNYRNENNMTMREFADASGLSKAYISILENNCHPKTGQTVAPSIGTIRKAAKAMHIPFDKLFAAIDGDVVIDVDSEEEKKNGLIALYLENPLMKEFVLLAGGLFPKENQDLFLKSLIDTLKSINQFKRAK